MSFLHQIASPAQLSSTSLFAEKVERKFYNNYVMICSSSLGCMLINNGDQQTPFMWDGGCKTYINLV